MLLVLEAPGDVGLVVDDDDCESDPCGKVAHTISPFRSTVVDVVDDGSGICSFDGFVSFVGVTVVSFFPVDCVTSFFVVSAVASFPCGVVCSFPPGCVFGATLGATVGYCSVPSLAGRSVSPPPGFSSC